MPFEKKPTTTTIPPIIVLISSTMSMAVVTQTGNKAANMMEFMAGQSEVNVKPASPSGGPMFRWYLIVMENQKGEQSRGGTRGKASTVSQFVRLITWKAKAAPQPLVMCCKVPHFTWWFNTPHCILEFDKINFSMFILDYLL